MDDPAAPIGHHWQDATHITFGVVTAGVFTRRLKLEGSVFNGREPDDRRWNVERIRLDSYSARITFNPDSNWSFTTGYGYMKSPEALHPDEPMRRWVASAVHGRHSASDSAARRTSSRAIWRRRTARAHRWGCRCSSAFDQFTQQHDRRAPGRCDARLSRVRAFSAARSSGMPRSCTRPNCDAP